MKKGEEKDYIGSDASLEYDRFLVACRRHDHRSLFGLAEDIRLILDGFKGALKVCVSPLCAIGILEIWVLLYFLCVK